jgi:hypothetical protein
MAHESRWRCDNCDMIWKKSELLEGENPFNKTEIIKGCPNCKEANNFTAMCEVEGCHREWSGSGPGKDGDWWTTCYEHKELRT